MRRIIFSALLLALAATTAACAAASGGTSGLTGKVWHLTAITEKVPAFQGVVPEADQANYTIEFKPAGTFQAKADCNQVSGPYTTTSSGGMTITLGPMTLAFCPEGSIGDQYAAALGRTDSYVVASDVLTLNQNDGGTLSFK
jgi:heat shock protein HslJ